MERLQKIIARAGLASRREAERWILEGRVTVNGAVVEKLGSQADPLKDKIKVDGKLILRAPRLYYLFHKPPGLITAMGDPQGRPNLGDLLEPLGRRGRFYPVGRSEEHTSELQSQSNLVCRLLLEKTKTMRPAR